MSFETWIQGWNTTTSEYNIAKRVWNAAQAEMREIGPCGKHPKMLSKPLFMADNLDEGPQLYSCTLCEEIRLAVEKARIGMRERSAIAIEDTIRLGLGQFILKQKLADKIRALPLVEKALTDAVEKALAEQATTNRTVRTGPSHTQWYSDKPASDTKPGE